MKLNEDVCAFGRVCEHLLASVQSSLRPMTKEETLYVMYYCKELIEVLGGVPADAIEKPAPPSPPAPRR